MDTDKTKHCSQSAIGVARFWAVNALILNSNSIELSVKGSGVGLPRKIGKLVSDFLYFKDRWKADGWIEVDAIWFYVEVEHIYLLCVCGFSGCVELTLFLIYLPMILYFGLISLKRLAPECDLNV